MRQRETAVTRLQATSAQVKLELVIVDDVLVPPQRQVTPDALGIDAALHPHGQAGPVVRKDAAIRVLIIDDNDMNIQLATLVLSGAGLAVESASDVNQGMRQIEAFKPDLILMDIQMPDMDGMELTRRLKASESTRHIPVVAFTAYAVIGDEARFLAAGFQGFIGKPFEIRTFADKVRSYVKQPDAQ